MMREALAPALSCLSFVGSVLSCLSGIIQGSCVGRERRGGRSGCVRVWVEFDSHDVLAQT